MYLLEIEERFSAAHALRNYPGPCSRVHGHNWRLQVGFLAPRTDDDGITVDLMDLKKLTGQIFEEFDHRHFNDHPYFQEVNPTSEKIAEYVYNKLKKECPEGVSIDYVKLWETDDFSVTYRV